MTDRALLDQAAAWLADGVAHCLAPGFSGGLSTRPRTLKALCEIAFLEYAVAGTPTPGLRAYLAPLLKQWVLAPGFLSLFRHNLVHANLFLPLAIAAVNAHEPSRGYLQDLDTLTGLALRQTKERLPFRMLDLLHGAYRLRGDPRLLERMAEIGRRGCLGRISDPADMDPADDYAVTHTVFYLTDFGRRPWPETVCETGLALEVLDRLSWRAEAEGNADLLGEFLLCRHLLGQTGPRVDGERDRLRGQAAEGTHWRGPADLGDVLRKEGFTGAEASFYEHYHTTLVVWEALKPVGRDGAAASIRFSLAGVRPEKSARPRPDALGSGEAARRVQAYQTLARGDGGEYVDFHLSRLTDPEGILDAVEYAYWASRAAGIRAPWQGPLREIVSAYRLALRANPRFMRLLALSCAVTGLVPDLTPGDLADDARTAADAYGRSPAEGTATLVHRLVALAAFAGHHRDGPVGLDPPTLSLLTRTLDLLHGERAWEDFALLLAHGLDLLDPSHRDRYLGLCEALIPRSLAPGWLDPRGPREREAADRLSAALWQVRLAQGGGLAEPSRARSVHGPWREAAAAP